MKAFLMNKHPIPTQTQNRPKYSSQTTALWLGDLHLDKTSSIKRKQLLEQIRNLKSNAVVVSGDISKARHLRMYLSHLAKACAPRPLYFVPGNHDFHGSSICAVESTLTHLSRTVENFHYLDGTQIIRLASNTCLIGHSGWADARAGYGQRTFVDTPDRHAIDEFRELTAKQTMLKMTEMGKASAKILRKTLPLALSKYRHVVLLTHVPPFPTAVRFNDLPCAWTHLPHFTNLSAGLAILGIARAFPRGQITVLAGHSHSKCENRILPNLTIRVGHARTGTPEVFDIIRL